MQTCSKCHLQSPDSARFCTNCQADLIQHSTTSITLKRLQEHSRVRYIRVVINQDCCPACQEVEGSYEKDNVPLLPIEGCSHSLGCRCFYEPMLGDIYP